MSHLCAHCRNGNHSQCYGGTWDDADNADVCWCWTTHDYITEPDVDDGYDEDRATNRYEKFYDRQFGDAA